jgi:ribosomal protein L18E
MKIIISERQYKILNEMGPGDLHYKNIINHYKKGSRDEKNKIYAAIKKESLSNYKKVTISHIEKDLSELTHSEIERVEKDLGIYDL